MLHVGRIGVNSPSGIRLPPKDAKNKVKASFSVCNAMTGFHLALIPQTAIKPSWQSGVCATMRSLIGPIYLLDS